MQGWDGSHRGGVGQHSSWIFTACRSDLDTSWECFMCDNSELSCQNFYNGSQWGVYHFPMLEIGNFLE